MARQLNALRYVVAATLLCFFAMAPRLWLDHPLFGTAPVVSGLPRFKPPVDVIVLLAMAVLLIPVIVSGKRARPYWIFAWCSLFGLRSIWDRMTWQPYFIQCFFMLWIVGWASAANSRETPRRKSRRKDADDLLPVRSVEALNMLRLIVISVYFWAGISKFNKTFVTIGMRELLEPVLPAPLLDFASHGLIAIPIIETSIALALAAQRLRNLAVIGALTMHLGVLWLIGPWGLNRNLIVIPWNLAMMAVVVILFWKQPGVSWRDILGMGGARKKWLVLAAFVVLPALSLVGWWSSHLSFQLYSTRSSTAFVLMSRDLIERLPQATQDQVVLVPLSGFDGYLVILPWSQQELGAFVPADPEVYRHIGRQVCRFARQPTNMVLQIRNRPHRWTGETSVQNLTCDDLLK